MFDVIKDIESNVSSVIQKLKLSKRYDDYCELEILLNDYNHELSDINHGIMQIYLELKDLKWREEKGEKALERRKTSLLPVYREKEGVKSIDQAKSMIEKDFEMENNILDSMHRDVLEKETIYEKENSEYKRYNHYYNWYQNLAKHFSSFFFRDYQWSIRTQ